MKLLCLSDVETPEIYHAGVSERFGHVDAVIACGDLPYPYLEFVVSALNKPLFYVHGNHLTRIEQPDGTTKEDPWGGVNLHRRHYYDRERNLLLAGIEGSLEYSKGPKQYTQVEMWLMVFTLVPGLLWNKLLYGRFLDCLVTHSPPDGIHSQDDYAHRGVKAFRWLLRWFSPKVHLHGHVHLYLPTLPRETRYRKTRVINAFRYIEVKL